MAIEVPNGPITSADNVPPRTRLLQNLSTQSQLLNQIFSSLASSTSAQQTQTQQQSQQPNPLPLLYQVLDQTCTDLLALRKDVRAHQVVWERVERKKREVIELEKRTRVIMRTLERERSELETMVREGREVVASVDRVERSELAFSLASFCGLS